MYLTLNPRETADVIEVVNLATGAPVTIDRSPERARKLSERHPYRDVAGG